MRVLAKKVKVLDTILKEVVEQIHFEKDGKVYQGALFFPLEESYVVTEVICEVEIIEDTDAKLVEEVVKFYKEHADNHYESTDSTMKHWQYMNGFTKLYIWNELVSA